MTESKAKTLPLKESHVFLKECLQFCQDNDLRKGPVPENSPFTFKITSYKNDVYLKTTGTRWGSIHDIIDSVKKTTITSKYFSQYEWRIIYDWLLFVDDEQFGFQEIEISAA